MAQATGTSVRCPPVNRRQFLKSCAAGAFGAAVFVSPASAQEKGHYANLELYNGIRLSSPWPPRVSLTAEPLPLPPYLKSPPSVIPIDVGRQLFVDDFLIENTTLRRTFHLTRYHPTSPVLRPDQPWEFEGGPTAMPFSDGVWYDPRERLFKMWYMGGYVRATCYAFSTDGLHWQKPKLDVEPGTNIVHTARRDSSTVWLDAEDPRPDRRFKLFFYPLGEDTGRLWIYFSADGVHWGRRVARTGPTGDRTTVFFNPFRKVWVFSIRSGHPTLGRARRYWETPDLLEGVGWRSGEPPWWVGADTLDPKRPDLNKTCELYNLDVFPYESLLVGLFTIWRGQPQDRAKPNEVCVGFTRDGFHWYRPDRRAFIPVSEHYGDWNWGNVQSAGGGCLVVGKQLYFYVSGRAGLPGSKKSGVCSTGLAVLRRDGFASMDAETTEQTLTTRPLRFRGHRLFVNVDASQGELRVEVLDRAGTVIRPFSKADCLPVCTDVVHQPVRWRQTADLASLAGQPVRFRFYLRQGRLYSFWVSPDQTGRSHGYVAAGGPDFSGPPDA